MVVLVEKLEPPNVHHLSAAVGWLELGNQAEARSELARISPPWQDHPDVLAVRWQICAAEKNWEEALVCAEELVRLAPDRVSGYLNRSYAMRRVPQGGLEKAWRCLRPAYDQFPQVPLVAFNLACYAAQLGRLDEAWQWLQRAVAAGGDAESIKAMALTDPDLAPIRDRLEQL